MKLLAFDTSTEQCSIALGDGRADAGPLWQYDGPGGAQASAQLIPQILTLLAQAGWRLVELDAIVFGAGPGSFTGLRTACSVAQGLALGAARPVLPLDCLMASAECARQVSGATRVRVALDARMDEVYTGAYEWQGERWYTHAPPQLMRPEDLTLEPGWRLAGNIGAAYGSRLAGFPALAAADVVPATPRAQAMLRLAKTHLQGVYIANVLKCRPPGNRNPEPAEVSQCVPFLERQIELLQPKLIVAMGRFAAQTLLAATVPEAQTLALGKLRGRLHSYRGIPVVVTYHPAYLLRAPAEKAKSWADLCLALDTAAQLPR